MSHAPISPTDCPPWLRLELIPDVGILARVESGPEISTAEAEEALIRQYITNSTAYRVSVAYPHLTTCCTGEHRLPAVTYTFVMPGGAQGDLLLSACELHDLRAHNITTNGAVQAFVTALPSLTVADKDRIVWIERLLQTSSTLTEAELLLDVFATWGDTHHKTVSIRAIALSEIIFDGTGRARVGWRDTPRASVFHHRVCQLLNQDHSAAANVMTMLPALFWLDGGLAAALPANLARVVESLGPLEVRSAAVSPD